jgi:hypothetical protein
MNREFLYIRSVDGAVEVLAFKGKEALVFTRSPDQAIMLARDLLNAAAEASAFRVRNAPSLQPEKKPVEVRGELLVPLNEGVKPGFDPGDSGVGNG